MLQPRPGRGGRKLIAALFGCALGVVRQPVLVRVDADEIFQRAGDADLFVRLELGQVDEHVRVHRRAAEEILVTVAVVFLVRLGHVVGRAIELALPVEADKLACLVQPHMGVAERVPGKFGFGNRDPVHRHPFLRAQVQQDHRHAGKIPLAARDHLIQPAIVTEPGEGGIRLRRIANRDRAAPLKFFRHPARDGFDDRWMRDDVFPLAGAGPALVVFLDPVGFQHHPIAGHDEACRQAERVQGLHGQGPYRDGIRIGRRADERGDARRSRVRRWVVQFTRHDTCKQDATSGSQ